MHAAQRWLLLFLIHLCLSNTVDIQLDVKTDARFNGTFFRTRLSNLASIPYSHMHYLSTEITNIPQKSGQFVGLLMRLNDSLPISASDAAIRLRNAVRADPSVIIGYFIEEYRILTEENTLKLPDEFWRLIFFALFCCMACCIYGVAFLCLCFVWMVHFVKSKFLHKWEWKVKQELKAAFTHFTDSSSDTDSDL